MHYLRRGFRMGHDRFYESAHLVERYYGSVFIMTDEAFDRIKRAVREGRGCRRGRGGWAGRGW